MARVAAFSACALACALAPATVSAQSHGFQLTWNAPAECPEASVVVAAIQRAVGEGLEVVGQPVLATADVVFDTAWHERLVLSTADGETSRALEAEDCTHLVDATILIVALAVNAAAPAEPVASSPPPALSSSPPDEPPPISVRPRPRTQTPVALTLGAGLITDAGILPFWGFGAEGRAGVIVGSLEFGVRVDYWPDRAVSFPMTMWTVGIRGCWTPFARTFELRLCPALDVGDMSVMGNNTFWMGTFAELGLGLRPARWIAFRLEGGPGIGLIGNRFVSDTSLATVYQTSVVIGRAGLYIDLIL